MNDKDRRLFTELVYGTISRKITLDEIFSPFVKMNKLDGWVKNLLEISVFQLFFLDKIPDHAILNDAVEIAKAYGNPGIGKFVNGVLRNVTRKGMPSFSEIKDAGKRISVMYSMPEWMVRVLAEQIGMDEVEKLAESLLVPSRASARVDTRVLSREEALLQLANEHVEARVSEVSPQGIVAEKGFIAGTSIFKEGKITVQDESSMLVAPNVRIEPGNNVLDACAAPGGKTTHMATYLEKEVGGKILALDIHNHKTKLIEENAKRLHVDDVVSTRTLDARKVSEEFEAETFDRILVDAPCSGLGLMRRKPDIKYAKSADDFKNLQKIQLEILDSCAQVLKKDGYLTYSTCTILYTENRDVVNLFLKNHPDFELVEPVVNDKVKQAVVDNRVEIYPHTFMTDGFFIATLKKVR
jgi:16S rRNA (cytosine967-C5)-methyltransferase